MLPDPAVRGSSGRFSMGRQRSTHHGLPPRMARKGSAYYYVCNTKPRKWLPLGSDLAKAKRKWAELEGADDSSLSVEAIVERYINREDRAPGTQRQYRSYLRAIAKRFPIKASELRSQHVALWRELESRRKRYVNGCIALLCAAFRIGHQLGLCQVLTVDLWQVEDRDRDLLPSEFLAIREHGPEWLKVGMDIGYLTGARPSDISSLRWDRIGERVAMRQKKTKQHIEFRLTPELAAVLVRAKQRPVLGLYVLATARGRRIAADTLSRAFRKAARAAGVENAQFRDIRAMAAKAANEGGQDYQALLGHTTKAMSDRYLKGRRVIVAEPVQRKIVEAM